MDTAARVGHMIGPALGEMGYDLVRVRLSGDRRGRRLQVMAERRNEAEMTVDDCAEISRFLSALLDAEDPIEGPYVLEVSSPGIDRPLTRLRDFQRFSGHVAKVELRQSVGGRRRFRGRLAGVSDGLVLMQLEDETAKLAYEEIESAKLVLTDELIAAVRKPATGGHGRPVHGSSAHGGGRRQPQ
jgi:ribosome maturation factor RimP